MKVINHTFPPPFPLSLHLVEMHRCNRFEDPKIRKLCLLSRLRFGNEELRRFVLLAYMTLSLGLPGEQVVVI